jgi:hypothetical protein
MAVLKIFAQWEQHSDACWQEIVSAGKGSFEAKNTLALIQ